MMVYLFNIFLLLIYRIVFQIKPSKKNDKAFCFLATFNWVFLSGMRHISIGADTASYQYIFETIRYKSWYRLLQEFANSYFNGSYGKDPGYSIFQKLVQIFTMNYQIYLVVVAIIFTVPLGIWIYKNSSDPFMSFILYSCFFYSFFSITGIRQTIATALVILIGYEFIKQRKFKSFLFLLIIAMTIHFSAIYFLPFYFIANKKITNQYLAFIGGAAVIIFIFKDNIFTVLSRIVGYGQYTKYEGAGTWTFTIFLLFIFILTMLKRKEIITNNNQSIQYINALLISVLLVPFTYINPSAMRIVQYYTIFLILLVPEIIKSFPKKEKALVYFVSALMLILLLVHNNPVYLSFWQG